MHATRKTSTAALGVAAILGLAACGSSKSTATPTTAAPAGSVSSATTAAATPGTETGGATSDPFGSLAAYETVPTALPLTTPLTRTPPKGQTVAYLSNGTQPSQLFAAALGTGAAALGWKLDTIPYDPSNPAAAGSAFMTAVNSGVNDIVVQALDAPLYAKFVPAATAKGIHVIDTLTSGTVTPGVTYVERTDVAGVGFAKIGLAAIFADAASRKVTPHILVISSLLFASTLGPFVADIGADVKGADCGTCSVDVVDVSPQAVVTGQSVPPIVSYLQNHSDINYIFAPNGQVTIGLLEALKADGLGSVKLVGLEPTPAQIAEMEAHQPATLGWISGDSDVLAWMSIDAAARLSVGDPASAYATLPPPEWLLTSASPGLNPDPEGRWTTRPSSRSSGASVDTRGPQIVQPGART